MFGMMTDTGSVGGISSGESGRKTWAGAFFSRDSTELMAEPRKSEKNKKYKKKGRKDSEGGKGGDGESSKKSSVKLRDKIRKMASRKRYRRTNDRNGRNRRR